MNKADSAHPGQGTLDSRSLSRGFGASEPNQGAMLDLGEISALGQSRRVWMARAAAARGYEFLCLTDHSHYLRDGKLEEQWREIEEVNARLAPFLILRGVEANITARGVVDVTDELLAELDWVVASLHTSLDRSPTERVLAAIARVRARAT